MTDCLKEEGREINENKKRMLTSKNKRKKNRGEGGRERTMSLRRVMKRKGGMSKKRDNEWKKNRRKEERL